MSVLKSSDASIATVATTSTNCKLNNTNARNVPHDISKSDINLKNSVSQIGTQYLGSCPITDKQALSSLESENADKKSEGVKFSAWKETLPNSSVTSGASLCDGSSRASQFGDQENGAKKRKAVEDQQINFIAPDFIPKAANKASNPALTPEAKPILIKEEYLAAWKNETDVQLQKFKKLAYEVVALSTACPNADVKLHSAADKVPVQLEFNSESMVLCQNNSVLCYVFVDKVCVASGMGLDLKNAKRNACEAALQNIFMRHIRIVQIDPESSELEHSSVPFRSPPPEPSQVPLPKCAARLPPSARVAPPETNIIKKSCGLKRCLVEQILLENFIILEPLVAKSCTPAQTLQSSADFNRMLLEYKCFLNRNAVRCVVKIKDIVLADVNGPSKMVAKNLASSMALQELKEICWVMKKKKKKAVASDNVIFKSDILNLCYQSSKIIKDNFGNRLHQKLNWFSERFKKQIRQIIKDFAASQEDEFNQEELVFSSNFSLDEISAMQNECRLLNLSSKWRRKNREKYLIVSRNWTARELFDYVLANGGETAKYVLVPPKTPCCISKTVSKDGEEDVTGGSVNTSKGILPAPHLPGDAPRPSQGMVNSCHSPTAFGQAAQPSQGNSM